MSAATAPPQQIERDGVAVEFLTSAGAVAGENVDLRFSLRAAGGTPLSGIRPAVWLDARTGDGTCKAKVQSFLAGSLRARPQVDLNTYYVVTLNAEPSVAVIDPLLGFGGSKLLTAVTLQSPGVDWALSGDGRRLFVSMPLVNRVAVVDTESWSVLKNVDAGYKPSRVTLRDGRLWVANDKSVTVVDTESLEVAATIPIGRGPHQIAFGAGGKRAFVTNGQDGTLSVVDTAALKKVAEVKTGASATGVAHSSLSEALYVVDAGGLISVVDGASLKVTKTLEAKAGLNSVQFAPGGRWGFITNGQENEVLVLDSSTNTVVTTAHDIGPAPDQVAFTDDFAYVRAAGADQVKMIRLASLGSEQDASVAVFPAGQMPPASAETVSFAPAIIPAPEPKAVLVANPADKLVYYYMEGMAAPMGNFAASKRTPKAAMVVDRSLRESEPGVFSIRTRVPAPGVYDVAFFLNDPRVVHCFEMSVAPNPRQTEAADLSVAVEPRIAATAIRAGEELEVEFRLTSARTKEPRRDVKDVRALAFRAPGTWRRHVAATSAGDGVYRVKFTVPEPGIYYVFVESQTLRLRVNDGHPVIFEALAP